MARYSKDNSVSEVEEQDNRKHDLEESEVDNILADADLEKDSDLDSEVMERVKDQENENNDLEESEVEKMESSADSQEDSDLDSDDDEDYMDYMDYTGDDFDHDDLMSDAQAMRETDIEYFACEMMTAKEVEKQLAEEAWHLQETFDISPSAAGLLLMLSSTQHINKLLAQQNRNQNPVEDIAKHLEDFSNEPALVKKTGRKQEGNIATVLLTQHKDKNPVEDIARHLEEFTIEPTVEKKAEVKQEGNIPTVQHIDQKSVESTTRLLEDNVQPTTSEKKREVEQDNIATVLLARHRNQKSVESITRLLEEYNIQPTSEKKREVEQQQKPQQQVNIGAIHSSGFECEICCCMTGVSAAAQNPPCGHGFCRVCWKIHFTHLIHCKNVLLECMASDCRILAPEYFIHDMLNDATLQEDFVVNKINQYVLQNPQMRFCPGPDCNAIHHAKIPDCKRVICNHCDTMFCFNCTEEYHSPLPCHLLKRWRTHCEGVNPTAVYLHINTKTCPQCGIHIEKNFNYGDSMICTVCECHFCWQCLGTTSCHGSHTTWSEQAKTPQDYNDSLKGFLFYYIRYKKYSERLRDLDNSDIFADDYAQTAVKVLQRCRITLKYSFALLFYMHDKMVGKALLEYKVEQLEGEVLELLSKLQTPAESGSKEVIDKMDRAEWIRLGMLENLLKPGKTHMEQLDILVTN